jgi:uncharacterized membrane protein YbhN (UPF0104 family)
MGAFWLALREVDFGEAARLAGEARAGWLAAAGLAVLVSYLAKGLRWRVLLGAGEAGWGEVYAYFFAGQLVNLIVPGRLGDLGRAYGLGGRGAGRTFALGTVVVEKLLDAGMFGAWVLVLAVWMPLPDWAGSPLWGLAAAGAAALGLLGLAAISWDALAGRLGRAADRLPGRWGARLLEGLESLAVFRRRADRGRLAALTVLIWGAAWGVNHLVFRAFGWALPGEASLFLLVALQVGFSAMVTPGALGVFELLAVLALGVFGVGEAEAFGYGVVLHAVVLAPVIALGLGSLAGIGWLRARRATPGGEA